VNCRRNKPLKDEFQNLYNTFEASTDRRTYSPSSFKSYIVKCRLAFVNQLALLGDNFGR